MMFFLPALLFLSAKLTAQAEEDISDDLKQEPLSELLYLFDVTSDAPVDDLKAALRPITLRHSFKITGERRYMFVATDTALGVSIPLKFPDGSQVTQYPAEHARDFFKMFGVTTGWEDDDTEDMFGNVIITMGLWDFLIPENTPTAVYNAEMATYANQYATAYTEINAVGYAAVASYPPMIVYFGVSEPNAVQFGVKYGLDAMGGPDNFRITIKNVVTI